MATVTATFYDREATERAIDDLANQGITSDRISVVMSGDTRAKYLKYLKGSALGGSLGAIADAISAPFLIAGPIAGALAGGGAGAAVGSVIGALVGAGVPGPEAGAIEEDLQLGGVLLAVDANFQTIDTVREILHRDGGRIPGTMVAGSL